jgi:hypothetical protein
VTAGLTRRIRSSLAVAINFWKLVQREGFCGLSRVA